MISFYKKKGKFSCNLDDELFILLSLKLNSFKDRQADILEKHKMKLNINPRYFNN